MPIWIWIVIAVIILGLLPLPILAYYLYSVLLVRTSKKKWGRECSIPDDEEYKRMFDIGIEWEKQYHSQKQPVEVVSDGLKLVGEYFDFGSDTSVIIIAGRMESLLYSYYFAEPYRRLGYNILVIDNRAHGLSEGKYLSLGAKEYRDILRWGELLHDRFHQKSIVIHGICIGSCVGLFALCSPDCPDYFKAMAAEGMFTTLTDPCIGSISSKNRSFSCTARRMSFLCRLRYSRYMIAVQARRSWSGSKRALIRACVSTPPEDMTKLLLTFLTVWIYNTIVKYT